MILAAGLKGIREPQNTRPLKLRFSATPCGRRPFATEVLRRTLKLEAEPRIWRPTFYTNQPENRLRASATNHELTWSATLYLSRIFATTARSCERQNTKAFSLTKRGSLVRLQHRPPRTSG